MIRIKTPSYYPGLAMAEYGLIGASVLLVCIVGCMTVGTNLQAWFMGLKSDFSQHAERAHLVQMEVAQAHLNSDTLQNQDTGSVDVGDLRTSSSNPDTLCGKDFCVSAPGLTGTSVATAGSNGDVNVTDSAANVYTQFAKIMATQGADPESVSLLTSLANKGHSIADMQNTLKDQRNLYRAYLNAQKYGSSGPIQIHSVTGNALVSWQGTDTNYRSMQRAMNLMKQRLGEFRDLSTQLDSSIDKYPKDARPLLTGAAQVVMQLGSAYHSGTSTDGSGQKRLRYTVDIQPKNIQLIHTNSNTICDNGGDQTRCHRR
jgi:Flp pilus assembly pilin Flp